MPCSMRSSGNAFEEIGALVNETMDKSRLDLDGEPTLNYSAVLERARDMRFNVPRSHKDSETKHAIQSHRQALRTSIFGS
eukprot:4998000-Amphidinium_carterae.1